MKAKEHELKVWEEYFQEIWEGNKKFEVRKNDRDYKIGDFLYLRSWDRHNEKYTGRSVTCQITYILEGGQFGLEEGYVVMSINN